MAKRLAGVWLSLLCLAGLGVRAAQPESGLNFSWSRFTLRNGLEVVFSQDNTLPLVTVVLAYQAGSIREEAGKTGLALLLENMMFMGSLNVGPMQHIGYINRVGGEPNAATKEDIAYYYQTVPANHLALALWLESDRMKTLEIDAAKAERARQFLLDEIVQRKAAEPYQESLLEFDRLLYPDFAHGHGVLGREEDIQRLGVEDVRDFYETYYVPNNAALVIVGDFDTAAAKELVEKYFGTIAPGRQVPVFLPPRPLEKKPVVGSFKDALVPVPGFHMGYRVAPPFSRDHYALAVIDYLLFKGKSARFQRKLVRKEGLALYVNGGLEKRKDVAVMKVFAMNNNETMAELCQKSIVSELNKLRMNDISSEDLARAKNLFKRDFVLRFASPIDRAMFLAEMVFSPPGLDALPGLLPRYMRVSPYEVRMATNRYLVPESSVILNVTKR
jgi:predicted Zn-dependent peptidase